MPYFVGRICALFALMFFCGTSWTTFAQSSEIKKAWSFQGEHGPVEIQLTRFTQDKGAVATSLHVFSPDGSPRSVIEEAGFLGTVLDGLPKEGIDVQSLDWIGLRFNETEAVDRVASCAAASKQWRPALRTGRTAVVYKLVTSFLNGCGAYEEWNRVFEAHGLSLKVAGVEEVMIEPFSKTTATCPPEADCKRPKVPTDALVQINIETITHSRAQGAPLSH